MYCKTQEFFSTQHRRCQVRFPDKSTKKEEVKTKIIKMKNKYENEIKDFYELKNKQDLRDLNLEKTNRVEKEKNDIQNQINEVRKKRDAEPKMSSGLEWVLVDGYPNNNTNYFNNKQILDRGSTTNINSVGFAFRNQSGTSRTTYGVEIEGYFKPVASGEYRFYTRSDDMSFIWLDGNMIVNNGGLHPMRTRVSGYVYLNAHQYYSYKIQFGENHGGDNLIVGFVKRGNRWQTNGDEVYFHKSGDEYRPGLRWKLVDGYPNNNFNYFNNRQTISTGYVTNINSISFAFIRPNRETYGVELKGYFIPKRSGPYRFKTVSDDMSFLWINDRMIVNNGGLHGMRTRYSRYIYLIGGRKYDMKVQFGENRGGDNLIVGYRFWFYPWTTNGNGQYYHGSNKNYQKYDDMLITLEREFITKSTELNNLKNNKAEEDFNNLKDEYEKEYGKMFDYYNENLDVLKSKDKYIKLLENINNNVMFIDGLNELEYSDDRQQHIPYKKSDKDVGSWEPCYDADKNPIYLKYNDLPSYIS